MLDPAVAAVRLAVRPFVREGVVVLVACSGGADSLALLAAAVFEGHRTGTQVIGVTVDHGLQAGSADQAARVVAQMASMGVDETASISVTVDPGPHGVEAGAREARYAAFGQLALHFRADSVLLGHTLDDQAETVLLGLARGSGARSMAGMRRSVDGLFHRPLLDLTRAQTLAACSAEGIVWWDDPHNSDPAFTRVRVRREVLPVLERELGPGVSAALARTADQLRADVDELDDQAVAVAAEPESLDADRLAALGPALRHRVLRLHALAAGSPASELHRSHVLAMDELVTAYHGQRWVDLPGHLRAVRRDGRIAFDPNSP
jgi:tRNA(Ile)-lysidine synthase